MLKLYLVSCLGLLIGLFPKIFNFWRNNSFIWTETKIWFDFCLLDETVLREFEDALQEELLRDSHFRMDGHMALEGEVHYDAGCCNVR